MSKKVRTLPDCEPDYGASLSSSTGLEEDCGLTYYSDSELWGLLDAACNEPINPRDVGLQSYLYTYLHS